MKTEASWLLGSCLVLVLGCDDSDLPQASSAKDAAAEVADTAAIADLPAADLSPSLDVLADSAPADRVPAAEHAPDVASLETGSETRSIDLARPSEVGMDDAGVKDTASAMDALLDTGTADFPSVTDVGAPDVVAMDGARDTSVEAAAPPNLTCRTDGDCCIEVEGCMARAYLYSIAPGASAPPIIAPVPPGTMCLPCIPPAVQVRCDNGQCVGEKLSTMYSGRLIQSHCGTVDLPDAGTMLYQSSYEGSPQTVWGC